MQAEDYPRTMLEFEERFSTDAACAEYLFKLRWPEGFSCPVCNGKRSFTNNRGLFVCCTCGRQTSVTTGTILHGTRKPLRLWFHAMWHIASQKYGANALGLQRALDLGSYNTAWQWLHKLRRAMVRPERDLLRGEIEMDETCVGGKKEGKRGRGAKGKVLVAIAVEKDGAKKIGRIRLKCIPDASARSLEKFAAAVAEPRSTIMTDDWLGYSGIVRQGYKRRIRSSQDLQQVHLVISLVKRWLLGTYQGAVRPTPLPYYLDEFTFRFNRRTSRHRGKIFYRLAQQAMQVDPAPLSTLVGAAESFLEGTGDDLEHIM